MKKLTSLLFTTLIVTSAFGQLPFAKTFTYETGIFDDGASEIVSFDKNSQLLLSTNGSENAIDVINISDVYKPYRQMQIDLSPYVASVNSVAAFNGLIVAVGEPAVPQLNGKILFFDINGNYLNQLPCGAMPDMVTFTPSGNYIVIANEGEPSDDYLTDPQGSISIVNVSVNISTLTAADVINLDFTAYDSSPIDPRINIYGNNGAQSVSQDLEPEYIAIDPSSSVAYVSLQENNAFAIVDLVNQTIDTIVGLGFKDHNIPGNGLDPSDMANNINVANYAHVFGMYQPDAITSFEVNGDVYVASANEGDSRDYGGYSEEARVGDLTLDVWQFPNAFVLLNDTVLGRLKVTTSLGDNNGDGQYDSLYTFGARSFSIWDSTGVLVWDSGSDFEDVIATAYPANFNSNNDDNSSYKNRSDDKGPEPEAITVGEVDGKLYAFIAMERMSGVMIYDIDDPTNPQFVQFELNRDFTLPATDPLAGDLGPECVLFIPKDQSPNGQALLVVASEVSGTISIYEMGLGIGIDEEQLGESTPFYPNPSKGVFQTEEAGSFSVYDSQGRFVKKVENSLRIDLSDNPGGLYLIRNEAGHAIRVVKN